MGKTEKKEKKEKRKSTASMIDDDDKPEVDWDVLVSRCNKIASPLAGKKLTKKLLKATKKAAKAKHLRRGVKEVVKAVRKKEKGIVIIAGDISPIDVITHLPVLCEENDLTYCYVPSKEDLGSAGLTKRPTSVVMVKASSEYQDTYDECTKEASALNNE